MMLFSHELLSIDYRDEVKLFKMKEVELIHFFIKFHAIVYLAMGEQGE